MAVHTKICQFCFKILNHHCGFIFSNKLLSFNPIAYFNSTIFNFLDIPDINFVVNFDYPNSGEDYIHRIGRTARAQRTGTAYTFFTYSNGKNAAELVSVMQEAKQVVPPKLQDLARNSYGGRKRSMYRLVKCSY